MVLTDTALLNSILFCVAGCIETCNGQADKLLANKYIGIAAMETQMKLKGDISDSTIAAVAGLAIAEVSCFETSRLCRSSTDPRLSESLRESFELGNSYEGIEEDNRFQRGAVSTR
jgi:hypothetical protein